MNEGTYILLVEQVFIVTVSQFVFSLFLSVDYPHVKSALIRVEKVPPTQKLNLDIPERGQYYLNQ